MAEAENDNWEERAKLKTQGCRKILNNLEGVIEQFRFNPRLTISDNLKVGFFTSDHATQTDCSEILPLKDLTQSTEKLMKKITSLQVDFGFLKDLVQLKFEDRLKEESWKILGVLQDRISEMKKYQRQAEETMRKSFQQQLSDAIAVIRGTYKKFFEMEEERAALQDAANMKMDALVRKLKEKEELLKDLKYELQQYEEIGFGRIDSSSKELSSPRTVSEKDITEYKMENERLLQMISTLEEEAQAHQKENALLEDEIMCLKEMSDQDQRTIQKLTDSRERLRYELDCEKIAIQDMVNKQKEDIEVRRKYASITAKRTAKGRESTFYPRPSSHPPKSSTPGTDIPRFLRLPSASLSVSPRLKRKINKKYFGAAIISTPSPSDTTATPEPVTPPAAVTADVSFRLRTSVTERPDKGKRVKFQLPHMVSEEVILNLQAKKDEEKRALEDQISILKFELENERRKTDRHRKEIDHINKNWERKFIILRKSFHVLKNEMFIRHTFFRQFAMISETSFNYIKLKPVYVHSTMKALETSSPTNVFHSPVAQHKYVDIPSDQEPVTRVPKGLRASVLHLEVARFKSSRYKELHEEALEEARYNDAQDTLGCWDAGRGEAFRVSREEEKGASH
ncbi:uncharacterized protein C10orf67 homolog, mitochondrial isoform X1 [Cricetulus griseus]|uniref:uncharacterized protein C10orf67 homolog, mitochondrial isoform X1 n=1 Tax=Cricetulus griseus TaxID=10029 RepID=UPI00022F3E97|nr:uncharacterized protein C10orf67 homolog, mitochondrial isoform X1 [Cricetulus griseus]